MHVASVVHRSLKARFVLGRVLVDANNECEGTRRSPISWFRLKWQTSLGISAQWRAQLVVAHLTFVCVQIHDLPLFFLSGPFYLTHKFIPRVVEEIDKGCSGSGELTPLKKSIRESPEREILRQEDICNLPVR